MNKVIKMELSPSSIQDAIDEVRKYRKWLLKKERELTKAIAEAGMGEATIRFSGARIDIRDHRPRVSVKRCENGYKVVAKGSDVCFIEFGTGVYYNGYEPYPIKRPNGIVGIGEYGKGMGKREGWHFKKAKTTYFTRGIPASMPMFYTARYLEHQLSRIVREVFASD